MFSELSWRWPLLVPNMESPAGETVLLSRCGGLWGCTSISLSVCCQNLFGKLNQLLKGPARLPNAKAQRAKSLSQTSLIFFLQFSEMQQIVPHLRDHTLQINLFGWTDCSVTSLLTNKIWNEMNNKYCPVLFNNKVTLVTVLNCLICFAFTSQG